MQKNFWVKKRREEEKEEEQCKQENWNGGGGKNDGVDKGCVIINVYKN